MAIFDNDRYLRKVPDRDIVTMEG